MQPAPEGQSPPAKKGASGCLIAAAVVGGLVFLGVIGIIVAVAHFFGTDQGKKVASIVGDSVKIATEAQSAPGAKEIRKAGCAQGAVMNIQAWERVFAMMEPDAAAAPHSLPAQVYVGCTASLLGKAPSCDEVERAYIAAVPAPPGRFLVQVTSPGERRPRCSNLYEADGTFVQAIEPK